jgi:uncharacterized membrane protein
MLIALRFLSALALALWLGAMLFFSAGVAPAAFYALPTHELAGNVVNAVLRNLHSLAYGAGGVLFVSLGLRALLGQRRWAAAKLAVVAVMLGVALYSGLAVSPPLAEIRAQVGTLDKLPENDPLKERFDRLHKLSVSLMGANMLLAIALLLLEQLPDEKKPQVG